MTLELRSHLKPGDSFYSQNLHVCFFGTKLGSSDSIPCVEDASCYLDCLVELKDLTGDQEGLVSILDHWLSEVPLNLKSAHCQIGDVC